MYTKKLLLGMLLGLFIAVLLTVLITSLIKLPPIVNFFIGVALGGTLPVLIGEWMENHF